jgi:very-short-patch-repair endonuclease
MKRHDLKSGAVAKARSLRRAATHEERIVWQTLRSHMPAAKFRRQVPIGPYFVDFISHSAKLVIELDGSHHALQSPYDDERTRFLESEGYRVIRFWNRDVVQNLDGVFKAIEAELKQSPSPLVGEGGPKDRMRGSDSSKPLTPSPLPQGEREISSKSSILES